MALLAVDRGLGNPRLRSKVAEWVWVAKELGRWQLSQTLRHAGEPIRKHCLAFGGLGCGFANWFPLCARRETCVASQFPRDSPVPALYAT